MVGLRMFALLLLSEEGDCKLMTPAWADDVYPYMSTLAGGSKGPVDPPVVLVRGEGGLKLRGCALARSRPAWGLLTACPIGRGRHSRPGACLLLRLGHDRGF